MRVCLLVFSLMTEPRLHMRSGVGAYGTALGVSMDTVSQFVSPVAYRSFSCDAQTTVLSL
jgi:hypothetical protein